MAYKVSINQPNLAKGTEVFIDGLGTFKNGYSRVVPDSQVEQFRNAHGRVNDKGVFEQGPSLAQAGLYGVTVERVSDQQEQPRQTEEAPKKTTKKEGGK